MRRLASVVVVVGQVVAWAAAPPPVPVVLTAKQQKQIEALEQVIKKAAGEGKFEEAAEAARQVLALRENWQGKMHWEAVEAQFKRRGFEQLTKISAHDKEVLVRADRLNREGLNLSGRGSFREAASKLREVVIVVEKVLGEDHPITVTTYSNLASCLSDLGRHGEALPLYRRSLAVIEKALGIHHPATANQYSNLAYCLLCQGRSGDAIPLLLRALAVQEKALGGDHTDTATTYNNLASCLHAQARYAEALPLFRMALEGLEKAHGGDHPLTASSYNSLAFCLSHLGRHRETLPLLRRAQTVSETILGADHPDTARACNNLASCLSDLGKHGEALPLYRRAITVSEKTLGIDHPHTATSYNNLASCLSSLGKHVEALPLYRRSLAIREKAHSADHSDTARGYNNLASCLLSQGRPAEALPLFRRATDVREKALGIHHPDTARGYNNLASCLLSQGRPAEAARFWHLALLGYEFGRLSASPSGFDRSRVGTDSLSPRAALASTLVRLGQPVEAWRYAESDLGRGLLDDLSARADVTSEDTGDLARIDAAKVGLLPLLTRSELTPEQAKQRDALIEERDSLVGELARRAVQRARARVLPLADIQRYIPSDAALVFWLDGWTQRLGCILRHEGGPVWVPLPGSGPKDAWISADDILPRQAHVAHFGPFLSMKDKSALLADAPPAERPLLMDALNPARREAILDALRRQRLDPLLPHLKGVRHLLVVPSHQMAAVPIEALTDDFLVSYVPSGTVFARLAQQRRLVCGDSLLVLADPNFRPAPVKLPEPPPHGLLVLGLTPGGLAGKVGLFVGDVLLDYDGRPLRRPDDLKPKAGDDRVPIKLWRDGKTLSGRVPAGDLGVVVDRRPVAEALAARRQDRQGLLASRGEGWSQLPGTRMEAASLAALVPGAKELLGSAASEQALGAMAHAGQLKRFRLLHLATHGAANADRPELTSLILAQDKLPTDQEQVERVKAGKRPIEGRLSVQTVLSDWDLDADLVVLSACSTGLGKQAGGEGMLGFAQALLAKKARSVVLSRWKVDDGATALLMTRFYQNLLGKREGLPGPMGRAEALREAKTWLRGLARPDARRHLAQLLDGLPRGSRGEVVDALPRWDGDDEKAKADRPYAHPYYWAAFVLIGDPY